MLTPSVSVRSLWALGMLLLVQACATVQLTNSWRSPDFTGPPANNVLVLGVSNSDSGRRLFEDGFARALTNVGVKAQSTYPVLPDTGQIPVERLKGVVASSGAQAVLITRLLRVDQEVQVTPAMPMGPMYGGMYGWYGAAWAGMPPSVDTYKVFTIETTLWDSKREKAIWSGTTQTTEVTDVGKATGQLAEVLIAQMKKDGVL